MAQVELPLTFGLGTADRVDSLLLTWPDGTRQEVQVDQVDTTLVIRQPGG